MHNTFKVFEDISELLSLQGAAKKGGRGVREEDLSRITDAAIIFAQGRTQWVGKRADLNSSLIKSFGAEPEFISLNKRVVLPAFIEPHTHLIFAGNRSHEFEWRVQGQTYQEISAKGGGILSTVKATRQADDEELLRLAQARADRFIAQGVTLLEVKSGYGQDSTTELRSLRTARKIRGARIVTTYLGPHSRSPDHPDLASYMKEIIEKVLPQAVSERLADRADIYIEKGFYTHDLAKAYFEAVRKLGLSVTAHVEQLSDFGGTQLALDFKPQSVDHVVYVDPEVIRRIADIDTTAVLLPASDFYLKMRYPPARDLIAAGARVALSTDFNPGTSPTQDLSLVGVLARLEMKMTLAEVISAFTIGGAHALGHQDLQGSIEAGKRCDFITLDGEINELFYSVGHHPVHEVWKDAEILNK